MAMSVLHVLMMVLAIQFYPNFSSTTFSLVMGRRRKKILRSWVPATLNLDSPDQIVKYKSMKYTKKEETEKTRI